MCDGVCNDVCVREFPVCVQRCLCVMVCVCNNVCVRLQDGVVNVAEQSVALGLAEVTRHGASDDRSSQYDALLAAETKAREERRGMHSVKEAPVRRVADLSGDASKAKSYLPFLQVCVWVCMYVCVCMYVWGCALCVGMGVFVCVGVYAPMCVCALCVGMGVFVCVCVCVPCVWVCLCVWVCMCLCLSGCVCVWVWMCLCLCPRGVVCAHVCRCVCMCLCLRGLYAHVRLCLHICFSPVCVHNCV